MILNRLQFRKHWDLIIAGVGDPGGLLWAMEEVTGKKSRWFVCIEPINPFNKENEKETYWQWCNKNCAGQILCYSTDRKENNEWWGFSHYADIPMWLLRWS